MSTTATGGLASRTSVIVAAYVTGNKLPAEALPQLIKDVHGALANVAIPSVKVAEVPQPAVPIKRSVHPDYIVCLEDGKKLKMLKRHLMAAFGLTPDAYRARWGLAADYPMVAPNYSSRRSALGREIGIGVREEAANEAA